MSALFQLLDVLNEDYGLGYRVLFGERNRRFARQGELERTDHLAAVNRLGEEHFKMQNLFEMLIGEGLQRCNREPQLFLILELYNLLGPVINLGKSAIIDQVATNRRIILNPLINSKPGLLLYYFKLFLFNDFGFFNVPLLDALLVGVDLLLFPFLEGLLD